VKRLLFVLLFSSFAPPVVHAQEAVVLSAGSARGLAHAGVLVGLERRGYQPTIVVGASMGAVIGGLYASGVSADSVWQTVAGGKWRDLFAPLPIVVGSERGPRSPIVRLHQGATSGIGLQGLVSDWRSNRELVHKLFDASARARGDFDRLPRRFRIVATDIATGKLVVLDHGDLARAVRASLSEPGLFAPVEWNGALLVDGGMRDYLPVAPARAMGARIVVASDVVLPDSDGFHTDAGTLIDRSLNLLTVHARASTAHPDVLVRPRIDRVPSPFVYPSDPKPLMNAGLEAALAVDLPGQEEPERVPRTAVDTTAFRDTLSTQGAKPALAPRDTAGTEAPPDPSAAPRDTSAAPPDTVPPPPTANWAVATAARQRYEPPMRITDIRVEDASPPLAHLLLSTFESSVGDYNDQRVLSAVDRLYATGLFSGVWPSIQDSVIADTAVLIVRADAYGSPALLGALAYDNDRGGRGWGSLRTLHTLRGAPLEWVLDGTANGIEKEGALSGRLPTTTRGSRAWTFGAHLAATDVRFPSTPGRTPDVGRAGGWFGLEARKLDPDRDASLTFEAEHIHADEGPEGDTFGPVLRIGEVPEFAPAVGMASELRAEARFGQLSYLSGRVALSRTFTKGLRTAAPLVFVEGVSSDAPYDRLPALGDRHLVPGLDWGDRRGRFVGAFGADGSQVMPYRTTLVLRLRAGRVSNREAEGTASGEWVGGGSLSAYWWLPVGRAELGYGAATNGDRRIDVGLGTDF
jgi:predicted acylesterase/phospholipase RssA